MTDTPDRRDDRAFFSERYRPERSSLARRIEERALGHAVGVSGYTTVIEAGLLAQRLRPGPNDLVLDLGTGRGWPASHLARAAGCRVIASDTPREGLAEAHRMLSAEGMPSGGGVVGASGLALPFPPDTFAGISHADVFC